MGTVVCPRTLASTISTRFVNRNANHRTRIVNLRRASAVVVGVSICGGVDVGVGVAVGVVVVVVVMVGVVVVVVVVVDLCVDGLGGGRRGDGGCSGD
jgi:hypothetical protein